MNFEFNQLIFIHIPKTGGVTIRNLLSTCYSEKEILWIKGPQERPDNNEKLNQYKFITGHFPYDMIVPYCHNHSGVITFLRHPIDRAISTAYYFLWSFKNKLLTDNLKSINITADTRPEEIILSDNPQIVFLRDNVQTRMLSTFTGEWGVDCIGKESVESAKRRLDNIFFCGIIEEMEKSVAMLCDKLLLPYPGKVPILNPTEGRKLITEIDTTVIKELNKKNLLDIELYEYALELFRSRFNSWSKTYNPNVYEKKFNLTKKNKSIHLDFDGKIDGWGWYNPVENYRWSGPKNRSFVDIAIDKSSPLKLKFALLPSFNKKVAKKLKVNIDGFPVKTNYHIKFFSRPQQWVYEGLIPEQVRRSEKHYMRIEFELSMTRRPCDVIKGEKDSALYGLAFLWLEVIPIHNQQY
jgi:hypothetical protein